MQNDFISFFRKHHRAIFYSCWLLINLVQAYTTELFDDEAYYWIYSQFPAWGYFDHPPMIALLIRAGYAVFHNELGVRLLSVFFTTGAIYLAESLLAKKNALLFYALCASLALAQIGGLMAVPDSPLMFFVALFFWLYRRFTGNMNLVNTLLLALSIALMLFTKYHGVLVVLFTALSNPRLFRYYQSYLVVLVVTLLLTPHLYWQYAHGFPSLQFHLFERSAEDYRFVFTIEYILGQLALAGPLTGWLLIWAAFGHRPASLTERALKFTLAGFYIFFLLSTFKGKTEANWTVAAFIGLMVLAHQHLTVNRRMKKWLYYSAPLTLLLVCITRAIMMINVSPAWWLVKDEVHENKQWVNTIAQNADNLPVVFVDTYQKPSKYTFYSGIPSMSLNSITYRRNNYNFWPIEDSLLGKPVYVVGKYTSRWFTDPLKNRRLGNSAGRKVPAYYSFSRVMIDGIRQAPLAGKKAAIRFHTATPAEYLSYFKQSPYDTCSVYLAVYQSKKMVAVLPTGLTVKDITRPGQHHAVMLDLGLPAGRYNGKFSISSCVPSHPTINSTGFHIRVP